jgi:nucleotide-binding universal stress UspA family protein
MYKKILVASDGSGPAISAAEAAAAMAKCMSATVTVVTVSFVPKVYAGDISDAMRQGYVDEWRHVLDLTVREMKKAGIEPEAKLIEEQEPAEAILAELERGGYDLLAVGRTGAGGHKMKISGLAMMGGVSMKLTANAKCSVLIVH